MPIIEEHYSVQVLFPNEYSWLGDGVNEYMTDNDSAAYEIIPNIAISIWVYANNNSNAVLLQQGTGSTATNSYYLLQMSGKYHFQTRASGALADTLTSNANIITGQWVHLCGTWQAAVGNMDLYINGVLDKNQASKITGIRNSASNIYLGGNPNFSGFYLSGYLYRPILVHKYLSAAEVGELYTLKGGDTSSLSFSADVRTAWRFPGGQADFPTMTDDIAYLGGTNNLTMNNGENTDIAAFIP